MPSSDPSFDLYMSDLQLSAKRIQELEDAGLPHENGVPIPAVPRREAVDHPQHYGGDTPYEAIKVMIAWDAQMAYHFCVGSAIKYFSRLGKKDPEKREEDLRKAGWFATKAADIYKEHLSEES